MNIYIFYLPRCCIVVVVVLMGVKVYKCNSTAELSALKESGRLVSETKPSENKSTERPNVNYKPLKRRFFASPLVLLLLLLLLWFSASPAASEHISHDSMGSQMTGASHTGISTFTYLR